jgi:hypothetical protein
MAYQTTSVPVFDEPTMKQIGVQPFGTPVAASNAGNIPTITATGNLPARPTGIPSTPSLIVFNVTAAAAVTLTFPGATTPPGNTTGGYVGGDVVRIQSPGTTLANTVTCVDGGSADVTIGVFATTANAWQNLEASWNGTDWVRTGGGVPI